MNLYKLLGFKSPGILQCLGMCNKKRKERVSKLESSFKAVKPGTGRFDLNGQLGGSLLISNKGKIVFKYSMSYIGDHCKPEEIIISASNYVNRSEKMGIDIMNGARAKITNKSSLKLKLSHMKTICEKGNENISEQANDQKGIPTENSIRNTIGLKSLLTVESIPKEQGVAEIGESKTKDNNQESSKETWINF